MIAVLRKIRKIKTKLSGSAEAPEDVRFAVRCECGEMIHGIRRATWIETECPGCCQSVFILPVNIYPTTQSVPSEIIGGSFADRLKVVVGELMPGRKEARPDTDPGKPSKKKKKGAVADKAEVTESSDAGAAREVVPEVPRFRLPRIDIAGFFVRTFTPFRMLMLAMLSVVCLTGYWMVTQRRLEAAQQTWLRSAEQAEQNLADSDLVALEATLTEAVEAGYTLDKSDSDWRTTLNLLYETSAVNTLASSNLLTAFHNAYGPDNRLVEDAAESVARTARSGTFVFDSWLQPERGGYYLMHFPATPGRHAVEVSLPLPLLSGLMENSADNRILFAAKIREIKSPTPKTNNPWQLLIDPQEFVLMTSLVHCEAVGLTVDEDPELTSLLDLQKQFVQSSADWEFRADVVSLPPAFQTQKDVNK